VFDKTGFKIIKHHEYDDTQRTIYSDDYNIIKKVSCKNQSLNSMPDWDDILRFNKKYKCIKAPIQYYSCKTYYEYKMPYISQEYNIIECKEPRFDLIKLYFKLISNFIDFSKKFSDDKIFMHNDLKPENIYYENKQINLIDLDSIKWMSQKTFYNKLYKSIFYYLDWIRK